MDAVHCTGAYTPMNDSTNFIKNKVNKTPAYHRDIFRLAAFRRFFQKNNTFMFSTTNEPDKQNEYYLPNDLYKMSIWFDVNKLAIKTLKLETMKIGVKSCGQGSLYFTVIKLRTRNSCKYVGVSLDKLLGIRQRVNLIVENLNRFSFSGIVYALRHAYTVKFPLMVHK